MLGLTARYADQWNVWLAFGRNDPDQIPPLRAKVDAGCQAAGRDPDTLVRTASLLVDLPSKVRQSGARAERISGAPEEMATRLHAFAAEGISHIQLWLNPNSVEGIEEFAPVLQLL